MLAFLRTEFPERFAIVGENAVKEMIARGKADAVTRRLIAKPDVSRYIALMFALGVDFQTKEPPRWVLLILSLWAPASERLDRIYDRIASAGAP